MEKQNNVQRKNPRGTLSAKTLLVEKYEIDEFLSADGEGLIYYAFDIKNSISVLIKEYMPVTLVSARGENGEVCPKQGSEVMFKTTLLDFVDLYSNLQKLTPCNGLLDVLEVFQAKNTAYAVMEYVKAQTFTEYLLEKNGKISCNRARTILKPIFDGVETMHGAGLVHRGICTDNIIVPPSGAAKLIGYATIGLRTSNDILHSQLYEGFCAPEQYSTAEFEGRYTDTYSLAAVYYTAVTGGVPVSASQRLILDSNKTAKNVEMSVPSYISQVLNLALKLNPIERIQNTAEFFNCLSDEEVAQSYIAEHKRQHSKKPRFALSTVVATSLISSVIVICIVLWFVLGGKAESSSSQSQSVQPTPEINVELDYVDEFTGFTFEQLQSNSVYTEKYLFRIVDEIFSDKPAGIIVSQSPAKGDLLTDENRVISLVVSKGLEMVELPDTTGFTQESAADEMTKVGLIPSFVMKQNDGSYASGCVIKTDPNAGATVEVGSVITVYIAADRDVEIVPTPTPEPTPIPTPKPTLKPTPKPTTKPTPSEVPQPTQKPAETPKTE